MARVLSDAVRALAGRLLSCGVAYTLKGAEGKAPKLIDILPV
jgi:hypothetical protein